MCCNCCCCKLSGAIALTVIGVFLLAIGVGGAVGFIYWDKHGGAHATFWVGIAFVVIGCIGLLFILIAIGLAIWACYKESHRHSRPAPAPASAPVHQQQQVVVAQAPIQNAPQVTEVHHHYPPPQQPAYYPPPGGYPPPQPNYYPGSPQPWLFGDQDPYSPQHKPVRYGDPSSAVDNASNV